MKVLVCGSRSWRDRTVMFNVLSSLFADYGHRLTIMHGGARGADLMAGSIAREFGVGEREFPAQWSTHGRRAGVLRNHQMLDEEPDMVVAFTHGSTGTQHTIDAARKRGIPVRVVGREVQSGATQ